MFIWLRFLSTFFLVLSHGLILRSCPVMVMLTYLFYFQRPPSAGPVVQVINFSVFLRLLTLEYVIVVVTLSVLGNKKEYG